jgi:hypothetical protein
MISYITFLKVNMQNFIAFSRLGKINKCYFIAGYGKKMP